MKGHLRRVLAGYAEGDFSLLRESLDPEVVYHSHAPRELFRFGGRHEGVANTVAAISAIASDYTFHRYLVRELIGEGQVLWALIDLEVSDNRKKIRFATTLAQRWSFRGVRVIAIDEYLDGAEAALKLGLLTHALPDR